MRPILPLLLLAFGLFFQASAQTCTTGTTTITGVVYAPNNTDPLPNVTVYIPSTAVDPFTPGVSCPLVGTPPSGTPLVGVTTAYDGSFTLTNVPVGTSIPIVAVAGRWRRQITVSTTACANTTVNIKMPSNQSEGDIPLFAIATGSVDQVECVLRKVGISDSEFTDPGGSGRIQFFQGDGSVARASGGAIIDASTPLESNLMGTLSTLEQYDAIMLPCEGSNYVRPAQQLANLVQFANDGGRVYSSHYAYSWMYENPPFNIVVNWDTSDGGMPASGTATVDSTFSGGQTLSNWLYTVRAATNTPATIPSATPAQITLQTIRHNFNGVKPPTQSWLTLNTTLDSDSAPVMQFVFDTPVPSTSAPTPNQCGRVLYNEYHVEDSVSTSNGLTFPSECSSTTTMTPQEKLLEYSLFELTDDGAAATLTPATQDFGTLPIAFSSAPQTFVLTNKSTFALSVNPPLASGDFAVTSPACGTVAAGGTCQITVVFTPTALGARSGTLSVTAGATTLISTLTGTGVADLTATPTSLNFGNVDVGARVSQTVTVTSNAPSAIPFPALSATGDYSAASNCGSSLPALSSCTITVTFQPSTTGARTGTLSFVTTSAAYAGLQTSLTGNGIDFTIALNPTSGATIAGYNSTTNATVTPIAGFSNLVSLTCTTNATASTCVPTLASFVPASAVQTAVAITTTSEYTVVGYTGMGGGIFSIFALISAGAVWRKRRSAASLAGCGLAVCLLVASTLMVGCSGKLPAQNASYTAPGDYTYTVTATDGFLIHSATYTLHLTAK